MGRGETRQTWYARLEELHLGVDRSGMIVAHALTEATVDDASVGADLIGAVAGPVGSVTGDAAYDTVAFYEAASARHAQVVVPPISTARVSRHGPRSSVRDRTIADVETLGRREWKKASGYHQQARVENVFSATSPSSAMAFVPGVVVAGRSRRALRAVC